VCSLKLPRDIYRKPSLLPIGATLQNYIELLGKQGFLLNLGNSLLVAILATAIAVSVSAWTSTASGPRVSLRVVDRGPGVPAEALEAIFEPFQRLGDVPAGDGVGLGLAVARGLMEAMGGTLTAEETPGGGLTLVVDLPVAVGAR